MFLKKPGVPPNLGATATPQCHSPSADHLERVANAARSTGCTVDDQVVCPNCGHEQPDFGRHVACEECNALMPTRAE